MFAKSEKVCYYSYINVLKNMKFQYKGELLWKSSTTLKKEF